MNKTLRKTGILALAFCLVMMSSVLCFADSPTDEILLYEITADVNDDATVDLYYHIQWKVLESDGIGPMSWISVGIPNSHVIDVDTSIGDNVDSIDISGSMASVYLDRDYYEGEVADIEFRIVQDYMYAMNQLEDGYTNYFFTPGWFDEIEIDEYVFRWNADKASGWSSGCLQKGDYLTWTGSLDPGETVSISVDYPNDAFAFNETKSYNNADNWDNWDDGYEYWDDGDYDHFGGGGFAAFGVFFWFIAITIVIAAIKGKSEYNKTATFGSGETKKKVTRTKVEYYPVCQGCGAPREEGQETCTHCGRSYIKSEETVTEEDIKAEDKDALKHNTNGIYHFGSSPNTYMRVNVINVPVHHSAPRTSSGARTSSSRPSGRSGGCAHSSCACACVSCACACACACAGGGRAGCTYKDFYRTDLKLKQLELKKSK